MLGKKIPEVGKMYIEMSRSTSRMDKEEFIELEAKNNIFVLFCYF